MCVFLRFSIFPKTSLEKFSHFHIAKVQKSFANLDLNRNHQQQARQQRAWQQHPSLKLGQTARHCRWHKRPQVPLVVAFGKKITFAQAAASSAQETTTTATATTVILKREKKTGREDKQRKREGEGPTKVERSKQLHFKAPLEAGGRGWGSQAKRRLPIMHAIARAHWIEDERKKEKGGQERSYASHQIGSFETSWSWSLSSLNAKVGSKWNNN